MLRKKATNQHLVLEYLAETPNSLIKPIARKIGKDYKSINNAVHTLKERGFIEEGQKKKTKGGTFQSYRLSEKGMAYIMVHGDEKILHQSLVKYEKHLPDYIEYLQLANLLSHKTMVKLLRLAGKATLDHGRVSKTEDWLSLLGIGWASFTSSERRELRRAAHRIKSVKEGIQKAAKALYEFAFPEE